MRHRLYGGVRGSLCKGALYSIGKLYNEHLYLLYKADQLTEVSEQDMGNLQVMLKSSYITAGTS
jgi:hypothetical protein